MSNRPDLMGRSACYLCHHDQYEHNLIQGCPHCTCLATPGEAGARDTTASIIAPNKTRYSSHYTLRSAPDAEAMRRALEAVSDPLDPKYHRGVSQGHSEALDLAVRVLPVKATALLIAAAEKEGWL